MYVTNLKCLDCFEEIEFDYVYKCPKCNGALDVGYDYNKLSQNGDCFSMISQVKSGLSHFINLLPCRHPDNLITIGESGTHLLLMENMALSENPLNVYLKNESSNPTGSFKDRPLSISVSLAKELGFDSVIIASTGNAGASAAAYAAKGGLRCLVLVPKSTPMAKILQAIAYGAQIICVDGTFSDCYQLAEQISNIQRIANVTTTYINPFNLEGDKTIAFEIFTQLGCIVPDYLIVPIGAGPLLSAMHKGFNEIRILGFSNKNPALIGVQAEGCAPIVEAFTMGRIEAKAWENPKTVASAIADPLKGYERDATYTLRSIKESKGCAISVNDEEILSAHSDLAKFEGLFQEPTSAASLAALRKLSTKGLFDRNETVVLLLTGHGLKDPGIVSASHEELKIIKPDINQLKKILS